MHVSKFVGTTLLRSTMQPLARYLWRPYLIGDRPFPVGPCLIYGNHSNRWDPFILNCFTDWAQPTAGVMTQEFFRQPIVAAALKGVGIVPARKRLAEPHLVRQVYRLLERGAAVVIFPEGGSRWTGVAEPWMASTVKLFQRVGVPIYPIKIHGSYVSWPRWADRPRRIRVGVEVCAPLELDRSTSVVDAQQLLVKDVISDEQDNHDGDWPVKATRPAAGIHRLLYQDPFDDDGPLFSTDGVKVSNRSGSVRLTMRPDSTLADKHGNVHTSNDLYQRVRAMPLAQSANGPYLDDDVDVYVEHKFPELESHGRHRVELHHEAVRIIDTHAERRDTEIIQLEDVLYAEIERNFKLQLHLESQMIQLTFVRHGSALQWRNALVRLHPRLGQVSNFEDSPVGKSS